jgi:hypothetical protein
MSSEVQNSNVLNMEFCNTDFEWTLTEVVLVGVHPKNIYYVEL